MNASSARFVEGNLFRHVSVMSFTASLGLIALFAVDVVDMLFIAMLGVEELAAAVGYAGSILFFTTSIGIGIAIATGAFTARNLGAGNPDKARQEGSSVIVIGLVLSCIVAAVVWWYVPELLRLLGASGRTLELATGFLRIILPSLPVLVLGMACGAILRAHGSASRAMYTTLLGGIVNGVLDPIFIFALELQLQGAALASVAARFALCGAALHYVFRYHGGLCWPGLSALRVGLVPIMGMVAPNILTNIATPIGNAFVTRAIAQFGEHAVAGMAVIGRVAPVAFAVIFALSGAIGPIIGQNYGAQRYDRVRGAVWDGLKFTAAYTLVVSLLLYLLRDLVVAAFNAEAEAVTLIYLFCGPLALLFFFNGALFVGNAAFNNLGHPFYSTMLNWGRNTLGTIPFVYVGALWFDAAGALTGQALGGVVFAFASLWLVRRVVDRLETGAAEPRQDKHRHVRAWLRHLILFERSH